MNARTMDFFAHQERAQRRTAVLVFLFVMAVAAIITAIYFTFTLSFFQKAVWDPIILAWVAGATLLVILSGSLFEIIRLSGGGAKVAEMLGGRPVDSGTINPDERRLLNVVEEMSIASGIPPPRVYLLDEEAGINAFAAGFNPKDAVIGVTSGAIRLLTRDELQGVIAHEFSHILHGDMRLNQRLMGLLFGVLLIGMIGGFAFRFTTDVLFRSRSRRGNKKDSGAGVVLAILLFSLVIMIIGYIGVFFGRLIKSATSRQREFLADAAAVQFTRNPDGLSGALKKIGAMAGGGKLQSARAEEASHLFFANGLGNGIARWMATHPDLNERIRRLDPAFDGRLPTLTYDGVKADAQVSEMATLAAPAQFAPVARQAKAAPMQPKYALAQMGNIGPERIDWARKMLAALPPALVGIAREPTGACEIVYGLLLSPDSTTMREQLEQLARSGTPNLSKTVENTAARLQSLAPELKLPLLDLALPTLRSMSKSDYLEFRKMIQALVEADNAIDLFEYALQRMLLRNLAPYFEKSDRTPGRISNPASIVNECRTLLSTLAYYGASKSDKAAAAFNAGWAHFSSNPVNILQKAECGLSQVDNALTILSESDLPLKRRILNACVGAISFDNHATVEEAQLLRAVADSLDCPMPPILVVQSE